LPPRKTIFAITGLAVVAAAVITLPIWGMGPAVFLDSERRILARAPSPDGRRVAQVERIVVGGAPSIVILIRSRWTPNWYLTGCIAARHYQDAQARISWAGDRSLRIRATDDPRNWSDQMAPLHGNPCRDVTTTFQPL